MYGERYGGSREHFMYQAGALNNTKRPRKYSGGNSVKRMSGFVTSSSREYEIEQVFVIIYYSSLLAFFTTLLGKDDFIFCSRTFRREKRLIKKSKAATNKL